MGALTRLRAEVGHLQSRLGTQKTATAAHIKRIEKENEELKERLDSKEDDINALKARIKELTGGT